MSALLGIDLGTSSVKVVVSSMEGAIEGLGSGEYPILTPFPGHAEQEPGDWWRATVSAVRQALEQAGAPKLLGIGFSGQMHGFVPMGPEKAALGRAIIWADQRSAPLLPEIRERVGAELLATTCGTAPAAGFLISTLLWLRKHDPRLLDRTGALLMPKDYIRFKLTGEIGTDESDAAATGIFDVPARVWADEVIERLEFPRSIFPRVHRSAEIVGVLSEGAAEELGLAAGIPVSAGCADQPAQAVGNGLIDPPLGSVTIGTGGQVFAPLATPLFDPKLRLHTFCHAPEERWYLLGAMLSAGMALRWLRETLGSQRWSYAELDQSAAHVEPGAEGLVFLPYLVGERSPLMDPQARGCFVGLTLRHGPGHLVRALLEGVAFALRQITDAMAGCGAELSRLVASGNGLGSPLWRQIVADVLNRPLYQGTDKHAAERAGFGAALIAGIGIGAIEGYREARRFAPKFDVLTSPNAQNAEIYESLYGRFVDLYPRLKSWFYGGERGPMGSSRISLAPRGDRTQQMA
ncbi:MAG: xylulokinase [Terrimicrobiaceae bacterium]